MIIQRLLSIIRCTHCQDALPGFGLNITRLFVGDTGRAVTVREQLPEATIAPPSVSPETNGPAASCPTGNVPACGPHRRRESQLHAGARPRTQLHRRDRRPRTPEAPRRPGEPVRAALQPLYLTGGAALFPRRICRAQSADRRATAPLRDERARRPGCVPPPERPGNAPRTCIACLRSTLPEAAAESPPESPLRR